MEREQKRRDEAHKQAEIQKIVDEHEKKRLAEASAALTNSRPRPSDSGEPLGGHTKKAGKRSQASRFLDEDACRQGARARRCGLVDQLLAGVMFCGERLISYDRCPHLGVCASKKGEKS